jgi:hypothetical protein
MRWGFWVRRGEAVDFVRLERGASAHGGVQEIVDWSLLDDWRVAVTIYHFPAAEMEGDVDNIVNQWPHASRRDKHRCEWRIRNLCGSAALW